MSLDEVPAEVAVHFAKGSHRWGRLFYPHVFLVTIGKNATARPPNPGYRHFLNRFPVHSPIITGTSPVPSADSPASPSSGFVALRSPAADRPGLPVSPAVSAPSPSTNFPIPLSMVFPVLAPCA